MEEELDEASPDSSKLEQQEEIKHYVEETDGGVGNITLPEQLQKISPLEEFVNVRHRWNTNEEIASILIAFDRHKEWLVLPQKIRPASGSMLLYNRKVVFYRRDGYCWKKRRNGSTIREDHMKLKVQGLECIYGSYVHSAILPTFHRRCYWLLQNPNIVLIHYLNVPYPEAAKPSFPSLSCELSQKNWTKEELVDQLRPMLSRAAEGVERDAEDDQKVEKMLDEILPLLIPHQDSSKCLISRPLAPAPASTTSSPSYLASVASTSSLKRPIRNHMSSIQPQTKVVVQNGKPDVQQLHTLQHIHDGGVPTTFSSLQPSCLNKQPQQQHKKLVQSPSSFSHPCTISSITATSNSLNPISVSQSDIHNTGGAAVQHNNSIHFLNLVDGSSPRFVVAGRDIGDNPVVNSVKNNSPDGKLSEFNLQQAPGTAPVYLNFGTSVPPTTCPPQTVYLANTLTSPVGHNKGGSSSMTINQYLQNQESQRNTQRQHVSHQAQHNHCFLPAEPHLQIKKQHPQQPAPVLTLHLKPSTDLSSNTSGFVLSLQEAAVVSQQGGQTSGLISPNNVAQPINLRTGQGLVLVASQTSSGIILNGISSHPLLASPAPTGLFVRQQDSGTPSNEIPQNMFLSPFTEQTEGHKFSTQFAMDSSMQTQDNAHLAQSFSRTSPMTTTMETNQHHSESDHQFGNIFPITSNTINAFPVKVDNNLVSTSRKSDFHVSKTDGPLNDGIDSSTTPPFSCMGSGICTPSFGSAILANDNHPIMTWALARSNVEPSSSFSSQNTASQLVQAVLQLDQPHQRDPLEPVSGPPGTHGSLVKYTISNPNSCDTLDGSFSSLPSADLNLDDLLDLNDLDDVSDLACSPFTPAGLPEQAVVSADMAEVEKSNSHSNVGEEMNGSVQDQDNSCINEHVTQFGCTSSTALYHQHNQHHLQQPPHPLSPAPLSNHHPGNATHPMSCSGIYPENCLHPMPPPSSLYPGNTCRPKSSPFSSTHANSPACVTTDLCSGQEKTDSETNSVIKDFSPDWAFTKTNTKILVAGPWFSHNSHYSCVFDGHHIPATLLQPGLLRCFTQYQNPGYVTLQVARDGVIISNCEIFEFCDRENHNSSTSHPEWFALDSNQMKLLLIERLDQLRQHFVSVQPPLQQDSISSDMETLESNLVSQVHMMSGQRWTDSNLYPKAGQHNLTLLHLAAGLGLAKLISCLIRWKMDNRSVLLEFEVDAQSVDSHACTPLMWACALGKIDAALTLYHWNASPLKMCNKDGLLPLTLARQKGFYNLANQVEQLERAKEQQLKGQQQQQHQFHTQSKESAVIHNDDLTCLQMTSLGECELGAGIEQEKEDSELKDSLVDITITPPPAFTKPGKLGPKLIRRYSEQVIGQQNRTLSKRNSVDLLPSGQDTDHLTLSSIGSPMSLPACEASSEPQIPVTPDMAFVASPAPRLPLEDEIDEPSAYTEEPPAKMDTDEVVATVHSPIIDVERISSDEELDTNKDGNKHQMVTLANQIIAAIPERIKLSPSKGEDVDDASSGRGRSESHSSLPSQGSPRPSSFGDDSGISTPMTDSLAFEEYRYPEFGTPASSLSPDSTCLPSPYSPYSFTLDSPPPTTAEFTEYFNAPTTYMEKDFSQLTLSDQEQRKLYEAAKVIQNAYRHYRDKQQQQQQLQQQKEIEAAVLIQSYYRRYKTYAYYKKMSHAAVLIQNQFRTYYAKRKKRGDNGAAARRELERLKKGRNQSVIIQQRFRSHYQRRSLDGNEDGGHIKGSSNFTDSSPPPPPESQHQDGIPATGADSGIVHSDTLLTSTLQDDGGDDDSGSSVSGKVMVVSGSERSSVDVAASLRVEGGDPHMIGCDKGVSGVDSEGGSVGDMDIIGVATME